MKKDMVTLLRSNGFDVEMIKTGLKVTMDGLVNPADVRTRVAELLSVNGYQGYYLKEAYYYLASKKPWRSDTEAYLEVVTDVEEFKKTDLPATKKPAIRFKEGPSVF